MITPQYDEEPQAASRRAETMTATATAVHPRTEMAIRIGATVAGLAMVSTLIALWYLSSYPLLGLIPASPISHGFDYNVSNAATLTWTAPGDDGTIGQATLYDIRYATSLITEGTWAAATVVANPPTPALTGAQETFLVSGLLPSTTYYFALKAQDDAGNQSALSNIATLTTACFEAWSCSNWGTCSSGQQSRACIDMNNCGTVAQKPATTQTCTASACEESWTCTDWSACTNGSQSRTCADDAQCGTATHKPGEQRQCGEVGGEIIGLQETFVVAVPNAGAGPQVRILRRDGSVLSQFVAYDAGMRCGLNVAVGDLGTDGLDEIIVAPGRGCEPLVKIFTYRGVLINQFLAYPQTFRGGVNVAIGNADNQGAPEIVVTPESAGGPNVRIFSYVGGKYIEKIVNFFAYNVQFRGGLSVAMADLDGDDTEEIITVPSYGNGGPNVRIFKYDGRQFRPNILGFFAYSPQFRGGVNIAAGDMNADGLAELVTGPVSLGGPHVRLFTRQFDGTMRPLNAGFFAFHTGFQGGVSVGAGDFDYNGKDDVVVAVKSGDQALVKIFRSDGSRILGSFSAFPVAVRTGVDIATGHFFPEQ